MSEPILKKTHELLEKLAEYVMTEVPTKREVEKHFQEIEKELDCKADKKDLIIVKEELTDVKEKLSTVKENVQMILNGPIEEGHELLFGEMISFITLLLGLTVANKHKAFKAERSD